MLAEELNLYKETYRLLSIVDDFVHQFPKLYKHTLGSRMLDVGLELIMLVMEANMDKGNRRRSLERFLIKFESLKVMIRLANEKKVISIKQASQLARLTASIGRQANGWKATCP